MIEIYWNRAVGINGNKVEEFKFPKENLSKIFYSIKNKDFTFLGEFYEKYGPYVVIKSGNATDILQKVLIDYGKMLIERSNKSEMKVMESIKFYHELEKIMNDYKNHMQDWYEIFDPYSRYMLSEEKFLNKSLQGINSPSPSDVSLYNEITKNYKLLEDLKKRIEYYIESTMKENFPNLEGIAGPILGSELILLTNGIRNLANSPASRIQILGAGKAFYRARKKNVPGPKHGIIFKHPFVHASKDRGKNARILSGKIVIAARIDYYSGKKDEYFLDNAKKSFSKTQ